MIVLWLRKPPGMTTNSHLPETIEEVIERLDQIVKSSEKNGSRLGYFAALYKRVTVTVKNRIDEQYFDDNERMERLDVVFANRYLIAYDAYQNGQPCTQSWQLAFDETKRWKPLVLQHLFGGMNAHIGLDLGIAAATIEPDILSLRGDFEKINAVLASLVDEVQSELSSFWPLLKPVDFIAGRTDEALANFAMEIAREAAWKVALDYSALSEEAREAYIQERDQKVVNFGRTLYRPGWLLSFAVFMFRLFEFGSIKRKIRALNRTAGKIRHSGS